MSDKIHCLCAVLVPEIDLKDTEGTIDFFDLDLRARVVAYYYQAHAWWRGDGPPIFVAKSAHSGPDRLLLDRESVPVAVLDAHIWHVVSCVLRTLVLVL